MRKATDGCEKDDREGDFGPADLFEIQDFPGAGGEPEGSTDDGKEAKRDGWGHEAEDGEKGDCDQ